MPKKRAKMGERWGGRKVKRDWKEVDEKLIKRGEFYLDIEFVESWDEDTKRMNRGKRGRPFRYPEAFIAWMSLVRVFFSMPYRQMQGFAQRLSVFIPLKAADYTTLCKRIAASSMPFDASLLERDDMVVALDSTGFRVTNRGEWINRVGESERARRGWLKVHIAVNVETKEVLGLEITREDVKDCACFESLVLQSLEHGTVKRVLADGGYDDRKAFNVLDDLGIEPGIKTRENASTRPSRARSQSYLRASVVRDRLKYGYEAWREKTGYGKRWNVESVISAIKRIFKETLSARTWQGMIREVQTKMAMYNLLVNL
jgi:hypothetical protein